MPRLISLDRQISVLTYKLEVNYNENSQLYILIYNRCLYFIS